MDQKALRRLQAIQQIRKARAEQQRARLISGISDGTALGDLYRAMDCGTGRNAELSIAHVARSIQVIERGLAVLRRQEAEAAARIVQTESAVQLLNEKAREIREGEERRLFERSIEDMTERRFQSFKSGVSEADDASDG